MWRDWVRDVGWLSVTRASESSYDSIRNPLSRLDLTRYRIHFLEKRLVDAVEKIVALGKIVAIPYRGGRRRWTGIPGVSFSSDGQGIPGVR